MQGIESRQHLDIVKAIDKFETLKSVHGNILPDGVACVILEKASELKGTYNYYKELLKELESCIESYENIHESLRKVMYPCVRKMNTRSRK